MFCSLINLIEIAIIWIYPCWYIFQEEMLLVLPKQDLVKLEPLLSPSCKHCCRRHRDCSLLSWHLHESLLTRFLSSLKPWVHLLVLSVVCFMHWSFISVNCSLYLFTIIFLQKAFYLLKIILSCYGICDMSPILFHVC